MRRSLVLFGLLGACLLLMLLAIPGFQYPIVSDSIIYALTGESVWTSGRYLLLGEPYAKHMPLHGILSYPFVAAFGYQLGMKISALLAGCGALLVTYNLLARFFSRDVALLSVLFLTLHHGFVFTVITAGGDPLFVFLFLLSVFLFAKADDDKRWYIGAGLAAGLACLARYNGVALFLLFPVFVLWKRRERLRSIWFWGGLAIGAFLFGLWFLRNAIVFGNPFYSEYTGDLIESSSGFFSQLWSNFLFYISPLQNVLLLLPFVFWGLVYQRKQTLLLLAMLAAWLLTAIWYVQGMRFAIAGYPILIGFGAWGLLDIVQRMRRMRWLLVSILLVVQVAALGLYAYGPVNAWFDRTIGWAPKDLGLSSEGFHSWDLARDYINEHAEHDVTVHVGPLEEVAWQEQGIFRPDIQLTLNPENACPVYAIRRVTDGSEEIVYRTPDHPVEMVLLHPCP